MGTVGRLGQAGLPFLLLFLLVFVGENSIIVSEQSRDITEWRSEMEDYREGDYLFHGSPNKIECLQPKQAHDTAYAAGCLSEPNVIFGHFIECRWDYDWNPISAYYC